MRRIIRALKRKITGAAISAASVIVILQATVLPALFDFVTDLLVIGLIAIVGWLHGGQDDEPRDRTARSD
jgi:hypothetical protein